MHHHCGLVGLLLAGAAFAASSLPAYRPATYNSSEGINVAVHDDTVLKLFSDGNTPAIVTLDYGADVEGYATFEVSGMTGNTSVFEMSYSETLALLDNYMADGPLTLAASMDTYRINQFNITNQTTYSNRLIQGGLRYQKLNLSSAGQLEISAVGFRPSVDNTPVSLLPGSFHCSDPVLNRIWDIGTRTVQLCEFPAETLPDFWLITDQGAFIDSLSPQPFAQAYAAALTAYELDFMVRPVSKGFGFTVLSDTLGNGIYLFVDVVNSYIAAHAGATELNSPALVSANLPSSVTLNEWHTVHSMVNSTQISIEIDGVSVLNFSQTSSFYGSFGLGASYTQAAYFTNVSFTAFGTQMYFSSLTNQSALADFALGTNPLPTSVDGSRRDRIAYGGDLEMAMRTSLASTNGLEYMNGSIALLGSFQELPGFFVPNAKVQLSPVASIIQANITGLIGYSFSLVSAMAEYYSHTGDVPFLQYWAPRVRQLFDWAHSQSLSNGLFNISDIALGGDWNYYDPSLAGVVTNFNLIYAYALKNWLPFMTDGGLNATMYKSRLQYLQDAVNANLWSDSLQAYYASDSHKNFISQAANSYAILSQTAASHSPHTPSTILSTMARELYIPAGALSFSNTSVAKGWAQKISPYACGYHLKAAFETNDSANALHLLHAVWGPMSDPTHTNYTGCTWEALSLDGTPGLGDTTSLCHAWGSGPTADLSRYVLGIQTVIPGFKQWKVVPQTLNLSWAQGVYPTPQGPIKVSWLFDSATDLLSMNVTAPVGTNGRMTLPTPLRKSVRTYEVSDDCIRMRNNSFDISGGKTFTFHQTS
ncbi:putative alpha-L-rhamnosidase C [Talaromyces proteolyticus]|uniref:Alpha-L-rhamnosidase C n=1 Tax=Talaromyces proteolyticus TaxID=1131652 RepID=A0AAD4L0D2_9EURO|nr:putative alpha-L-rhamnosidase C [Talaromyces proteolyticus]KAH8701535.1 putative alpha-L-rhamnosidase C [Talaromyces proteolyticus]